MRGRWVIAVAIACSAAGVVAAPGTASATSLDVKIPCGCQPLHDFAGESGYTQPVGNAVGNTPASDNPTGSVGHADESNGLGITGQGLVYSSAVVQFK
jgi:hypothetical protein